MRRRITYTLAHGRARACILIITQRDVSPGATVMSFYFLFPSEKPLYKINAIVFFVGLKLKEHSIITDTCLARVVDVLPCINGR